MITAFLIAIVTVFISMVGWFLVSLVLRRQDIADVAWGIGFILIAVAMIFTTPSVSAPLLVVSSLVAMWGIRLALHIAIRNHGKPEDSRYAAWRAQWGKTFIWRSFLQVFMLQGLFMLLIATPLIVAASSRGTLSVFSFVGVGIWLIGFLFESLGDYQLQAFIKNPGNTGRIMKYGLWHYTRHPNYFGEITQWWGILVIVITLPLGWIALISPITITLLILGVSGIPMLERRYVGNDQYDQYKKETSAFFPLPARSVK